MFCVIVGAMGISSLSSSVQESSMVPETSISYNSMNEERRRPCKCKIGSLIVILVAIGVVVGIGFALKRNTYGNDTASADKYVTCGVEESPRVDTLPHQDFTLPPYQPSATGKGAKYAKIAWDMQKGMSLNGNRNPCNDFYEYACGNWKTLNPAEENERLGAFNTVRQQMHIDIKNLLAIPSSLQESDAVRKAKRLYKSCMNTVAINSRRSQPLQTALKEVSALDTPENDIVNVLIKMARYKVYPLGVFRVETDLMNTSRTVLTLDQPFLSMRHLENTGKYPKNWQGYRDWVNQVVYLLNEDKYGLGKEVVGDTEEMMNLMAGLTKLTTDPNDRPDLVSRYHKYTLGSLSTNFPGFDWKRYISGTLARAEVNVSLTDDETVIVYEPNYFQQIGRYLNKAKNSTVYDYVRWSFTWVMFPYLSHSYQYSVNSYYAVFDEHKAVLDRWKICEKITDQLMSNVTGRLLVDSDPDPEALEMTKEMITDIKKVFETRIKGKNWMDDQTTKKAIEKLDAMGELIGYPADIMDNNLLDKQYEDFKVESDYFENVMEGRKRMQITNLRTFRKPTNREQWTTAPTTVNAFHMLERNTIVVPYGILRKPFFSSMYPRSVLYARLGTILAHEMTHGFDNKGRQYGKDGSVEHWWTPGSLSSYLKKQSCFETQYWGYSTSYSTSEDIFSDSYKIVEVNGTRTLPENIADNGGIKDSFRAYTQWVNRHGEEPELPYLSMTNNQVFYLAFAQGWCESTGIRMAEKLFRRGTHSPGEFRVKGSLQNSCHFAQTFKCASGSEMNPRHKCILW